MKCQGKKLVLSTYYSFKVYSQIFYIEVSFLKYRGQSRGFFVRKFLAKLFLYRDLGFVLFWRKNIGAKAARNMLVKFTPGGDSRYSRFRLYTVIDVSSRAKKKRSNVL
jgi:hypothetical protein